MHLDDSHRNQGTLKRQINSHKDVIRSLKKLFDDRVKTIRSELSMIKELFHSGARREGAYAVMFSHTKAQIMNRYTVLLPV